MFPVRRVDRRSAQAVETLGTKPKFWFLEGDRRILFKAEERGTGEDWAEKIACHLCELLNLPHVHYELAEEFDGATYIRPGVICETCSPAPLSLMLGNRLLQQRDPAYPAKERRKYKVREHTVQAVAEAIDQLARPADEWMVGVPSGIQTALDVFVGYLLLDAWIANQDRHHENWAALQLGDQLRLAPTFDHGASLARNISDEERKERLTTNDMNRSISHFARRASSAFYASPTDARPLSTLDAYVAFARFAPSSARLWLERLKAVDRKAVEQILAEVPPQRMSKITKDFTLELLFENHRRILEAYFG